MKSAEPQAVPIPDETLTPCPHCKGVGSWAGTSPRGVCGQTITPCSYCAATGLRYPEERIAHLEAQLRDAERTLAKREAMLDEAARLEMQRALGLEHKLTRVSEFLCDSCRINVGMQMDGALRGENAELEVRLADAARKGWNEAIEATLAECPHAGRTMRARIRALARGPVQGEQP